MPSGSRLLLHKAATERDPARQLFIRDRLAIGNLEERDPYRMLELSALDMKRRHPARSLAGKIGVKPRPGTLEHAHRRGVLRVAGAHGAAARHGIAALNLLERVLFPIEHAASHIERGLVTRERRAVMRLVAKPQAREPARIGGERDIAQRRMVGGGYHAAHPLSSNLPIVPLRGHKQRMCNVAPVPGLAIPRS